MGVAGDEAFGQEDLHGFTEEAGAGVVLDEGLPLFGAVAGFFFEFALGSGEGIFAGFELARGQFPEELIGGVAVLALDDDPGILFVPNYFDNLLHSPIVRYSIQL